MIQLIIFILSTSSLTWILTRSKLLKPFREYITRKNKSVSLIKFIYNFLSGMLSCHACTGLWAGLVIYFIQKYDFKLPLYMFIGSVSSLIIIDLIILIEKR